MIDVIAALEVAAAANSLGVTLSDAQALYGLYGTIKDAKKLDLTALSKTPSFQADLDALARVTSAASHMMRDKDKAPQLLALINSLS